MDAHIPTSEYPRIVIVGAGFAGLRIAAKLANQAFQIVLLDRNNFHQFQPLFYQVATAGLAPSSISFPVRKAFHKKKNVVFRIAEVSLLDTDQQIIKTNIGDISYQKLILATGADTNYFGNKTIQQHALPMKSVQESLTLRNHILECIELALTAENEEEKQALLNVVIVGGGPTGTEVSGALSEMRHYVLPKDYPEIDFNRMHIYLLEGGPRLLSGMSHASGSKSLKFLQEMNVDVSLNTLVQSYDGKTAETQNGKKIETKTLIWAAGVKGSPIRGLPEESILSSGRVTVDPFSKVNGVRNVFAIGDVAYMEEDDFPKGHPQVAQVAIQQADHLVKNFKAETRGGNPSPFHYRDLGSMATIGRNKAVVDLPFIKFQGFFAWLFWLFVHLMAILGVRNKLMVFLEWTWSYITFDQSLRLVIKQKPDPQWEDQASN